jgi:predicted nucleic acid-binding protein
VIVYLDASALVKRYVAERAFAGQWPDFAKVPVTEALVARTEALAWDAGLRGYDAVQLASALTWQESVGAEITLATFDRSLTVRSL